MPRILLLSIWVAVLGGISAGSPLRAEFTLIDRTGAWFFYTQQGVGQGNAACQVVSCVRGVCGAGATSRTQFSLYDARGGSGPQPEFIGPDRANSGDVAILQINGRSFRLRNLFGTPQFYMQAADIETGKRIIGELRALEARDRLGKFQVVDPQGRKHQFTSHGVTESLDRMERRCTQRK